MKRWLVAVGLLGSTTVWAVCNLPNPNSTTIPSTQQSLGVAITSPPTNTQVPIPPGTQAVDANCAIGTVPGQPINVLYVVDVSGSTDNPGNVDTNGDNVINSADNWNGDAGDTQNGETLDGEIAGVVALNNSIGNPLNVRVGATAFATGSVNADMRPTAGDQVFTVPPQVDLSGNLRADVIDVLRTFRSTSPTGGTIGIFTAKGPGPIGNNTNFIAALNTMNTTLAGFPAGTNIVYFLSDGMSNVDRKSTRLNSSH